MCGAGLPTPGALESVMVGKDSLAEICISCKSNIRTAIIGKKTQIDQMKRAVQAAYDKQLKDQVNAEASSDAKATPEIPSDHPEH